MDAFAGRAIRGPCRDSCACPLDTSRSLSYHGWHVPCSFSNEGRVCALFRNPPRQDFRAPPVLALSRNRAPPPSPIRPIAPARSTHHSLATQSSRSPRSCDKPTLPPFSYSSVRLQTSPTEDRRSGNSSQLLCDHPATSGSRRVVQPLCRTPTGGDGKDTGIRCRRFNRLLGSASERQDLKRNLHQDHRWRRDLGVGSCSRHHGACRHLYICRRC